MKAAEIQPGAPVKIDSPRFGLLEVDPARIIEFPRGLAGFEDCNRFSLFHPEDEPSGYFILQSLDDAAVAFHIADPARPDLGERIVLSDEEAADLAITGPDRSVGGSVPLAVMVILSKSSPGQPVRANHNAPLVINLETRRGLQHMFLPSDDNPSPA